MDNYVMENNLLQDSQSKFKSPPILFLVFNRIDHTKLVFEQIRKAKPQELFVAADGPRKNKIGEKEICDEVRSIVKKIDWDCELHTLFREQNLGCKVAVSSAIDWFFQEVDKGIILEDDCLPDPSFFCYCEELLDYYKDDERVMMISGDNFQQDSQAGDYSYYFSAIPHVWGWATWARAWALYDVNIRLWPLVRETDLLNEIWQDKRIINRWVTLFDSVYDHQIDTWDYQWTFTTWVQHGLSIIPNKNLVTNIGFGKNATHTKDDKASVANLKSSCVDLPLIHPSYVVRNLKADLHTMVQDVSDARWRLLLRKIKTFIKNKLIRKAEFVR